MSIRLKSPIVLAHGLFGFSRIGLGPLTLTTYFRGIPDYLRAAGNRVLVTRVHPIAGVEFRAGRLGDRILRPSPMSRSTSSATAWGGWTPGDCWPSRPGESGCSASQPSGRLISAAPCRFRQAASRTHLSPAGNDGPRSAGFLISRDSRLDGSIEAMSSRATFLASAWPVIHPSPR